MLEDQLPRQQEMNHQTAKGKLKLLLKNQAGHINLRGEMIIVEDLNIYRASVRGALYPSVRD